MSREPSNSHKVHDFMQFLGAHARGGRVYLTGGASAVIVGWRDLTVDVDLKLDPEPSGAFACIARDKEVLDMNVELAAPEDFIPALPDWRERSEFIPRHDTTDFFHYDFYAQALAKIARGYGPDRSDVEAIEPGLERYPAIDPIRFREKVDDAVAWLTGETGNHDNDLEPSP